MWHDFWPSSYKCYQRKRNGDWNSYANYSAWSLSFSMALSLSLWLLACLCLFLTLSLNLCPSRTLYLCIYPCPPLSLSLSLSAFLFLPSPVFCHGADLKPHPPWLSHVPSPTFNSRSSPSAPSPAPLERQPDPVGEYPAPPPPPLPRPARETARPSRWVRGEHSSFPLVLTPSRPRRSVVDVFTEPS